MILRLTLSLIPTPLLLNIDQCFLQRVYQLQISVMGFMLLGFTVDVCYQNDSG